MVEIYLHFPTRFLGVVLINYVREKFTFTLTTSYKIDYVWFWLQVMESLYLIVRNNKQLDFPDNFHYTPLLLQQ
jgi:hypothetical protein